MSTKGHALDILKITCLVAVLTGLLFAITAWAQTADPRDAVEAEVTAPQDGSESSITGSQDPAVEARQRRKALLNARRQARQEARQQTAAQNQAVQAGMSRPAAPLKDIQISLKVDPRLTRSMYMGDRWVSAPTYVGTIGQDTIEARIQGVDARGATMPVSPKWIPADPEMVTVTPAEGNEVRITVRRAGQSSLKVVAPGVSKELVIKAAYPNHTQIQAEISQKP